MMRQRDRVRHPGGWPAVLAIVALMAGAASIACETGTASSSPSTTSGGSTGGAGAQEGTSVEVVKEVSPSVVLIQTSSGLGSGEVYDSQGHIVTNAHVVGDATSFRVTTSAGKVLQGTLTGTFPPDDIAVIKVDGNGLKPARFGDSSRLQVGQAVLAIGNPLGLVGSVTSGIVSALNRVVSEGEGGGTLPDAIQTSAPINPGNSGGALVSMASEVVGIPTLGAVSPGSSGAPAPGIGFAISSNRARVIADQLVQGGRVTNSRRAYLGVQAANTDGGKGVVVVQVVPGGPAAQAGIGPGALITAVDGKPTPTTSQLSEVLAGLSPGQTVPVAVVQPNGSRATVSVTLGPLPG